MAGVDVTPNPTLVRQGRGSNALHWPGWAHLPRDARDVLFLLGVIAWTIAPHAWHLPVWCAVLCLAVIGWRAVLAVRNGPLPSRWVVMAVLVLTVGLTWFTHRTVLGKDAGVTLLVVLMSLKTLELRARRDALVVFFLGFFIVLTNFLYAQTLLVALAMLLSVWGLLTALVLAHMPVGRPALSRAAGVAGKAALLGAPIMVALFLFFPRMPPLWAIPQDDQAKTGLSGTLRMGGVAELAADETVAFRVRFEGPAPERNALYWRGPVLSRFDGLEWKRSELAGFGTPAERALKVSGNALTYEMTLEPQRLAMLPLLEVTPPFEPHAPQIDGLRLIWRRDLQWATNRAVAERLRFKATAFASATHGLQENRYSLQEWVELPAGYNPRMLAWAVAFQRNAADASHEALVQAVLAHIRSGYSYTLTPGTYGDEKGVHAIDEFWLDRKQGFCEHFATAFVVAMRAMDIPARVVTGYQGADEALQDGLLVARNSHAHAWAEVWLAGRGWVRVDPTAAVAPERVQISRSLRAPGGAFANAMNNLNPGLASTLRETWERINNRWNQWVLNYSRTEQFDLLERLGVRSPSWYDLAYLLLGLMSLAGLAGALWAWWDRHRKDPWQRLHARIAKLLGEHNVSALPHEAPRTLARKLQAQLGRSTQAAQAAQLLLDLERRRYGRAAQALPEPGWWPRFKRALASV
jgi:protein-glutamine gamma-glutamyltransferase